MADKVFIILKPSPSQRKNSFGKILEKNASIKSPPTGCDCYHDVRNSSISLEEED